MNNSNTSTTTTTLAAVPHIPLKGILEKDIVEGNGYADPYKHGLWI